MPTLTDDTYLELRLQLTRIERHVRRLRDQLSTSIVIASPAGEAIRTVWEARTTETLTALELAVHDVRALLGKEAPCTT